MKSAATEVFEIIYMRKHNKLKDIIINHVFDHCNNEKVQRIESPGGKITYDDPKRLEDPGTKSFVEQAKKSGQFRVYFTKREKEYCKVLIDGNKLHKSLIDKLTSLGFRKGERLYGRIEKAHNRLVATSYLARNKPIENEVKLTEKGLKHYLEGKSFEHDFTARRNSRIAIVISIISVLIALGTMIFK